MSTRASYYKHSITLMQHSLTRSQRLQHKRSIVAQPSKPQPGTSPYAMLDDSKQNLGLVRDWLQLQPLWAVT